MLKRLVFRLRVEEAIALAFLVPTTWLTIVAFDYARAEGVLGARYPGGVVRLAVAFVLLFALGLGSRLWPGSSIVRGLRETVPFLACVLIYTNLHDTIGFVNHHKRPPPAPPIPASPLRKMRLLSACRPTPTSRP